MSENGKLLRQFTEEILQLERGGHRIRLEISPNDAIMLVGQIQLALRHPGNNGLSADFGRRVVATVEAYFRSSPAVLEVIRQGWDQTL